MGIAMTSSGATTAIVAAVFSTPCDGDRREDEAERERAGIPHEDLRRVVVRAEEGERRAAHDGREHGRVRAAERDRQDRERERGDADDPGRERIHPVDQVDEVGQPCDPEHGDRISDPADVVVADQRQGQVVEDDVVARDGDERDQDHPDELHDRPEPPDVVGEPEQGGQDRPDQDAEVGTVEIDEDRHRHEDPDDDREPADAGDGPRVDPRPVGLVVDSADARSERGDERRQHQDDADRDEKTPERRRVLHERAEGVREGHGRSL